ncbi:MAG: tetraacyldisaccharide 4'-kinase, partial [Alphaproteobacteria bacterium]|nr:tetraacyldisaccharide 4'-kinase [Alphaproteobacteria bacterium]
MQPLGAAYGGTVAWRARHARPLAVPAKVICVGSLSSGGSGKTPVAIAIGKELLRQGLRVVFLSRGYGGSTKGPRVVDPAQDGARDVGDEPLLLARISPAIVASDRRLGAALAVSLGAEVIVMDDGHQNFALRKNLSIVVVHAE